MKYKKEKANKWIYPKKKGYRIMCCDCGLVHEMDFRIVGAKKKRIEIRFRLNNRATSRARKALNGGGLSY